MGTRCPDNPTAWPCFQSATGSWVLLRNHELSGEETLNRWSSEGAILSRPKHPLSPTSLRATLAESLVEEIQPETLQTSLDANSGEPLELLQSRLVLSGTDGNCAGGVVDNAWISCEESSADGHGYAFITRPEDDGLQEPRPVTSWGRFHREAVARHKEDGAIFMTEDRSDGLFYRFLPDNPSEPFGSGRLQALRIPDVPDTNPYEEGADEALWENGQTWPVEWVDIADPAASEKPCRVQGQELGSHHLLTR